jgi:hypothetical protein
MKGWNCFVWAAGLGLVCLVSTPAAHGQISVSIGAPPACPYGYFDYAPYNCAPAGYYGPQYFNGGAFVGVGPWFHGPADFHGTVNNKFDPQHGYKGALPKRGDHPDAHAKAPEFHGNEERDGRGHATGGKH